MFCNYCGAINPGDAHYCSACGKAIVWHPPQQQAEEAPAPVPQIVSEVGQARTGVVQALPYRWGKFQGWVLIITGPVLFLAAVGMLLGSPSDKEAETALGYLLIGILNVPTGTGILKKRRYGLILVYVYLVLGIAGCLISIPEGAESWGTQVAQTAVWAIITYYYYKRRQEFR